MVRIVVVAALVWSVYALRGRRWFIAPRLSAPQDGVAPARVVAIVPARNEAAELPLTLPQLLQQGNGTLQVVLVDDHSADGTADVARRLAAATGASERLHVMTPPPLPAGWTGKVWAQQYGFEAARALRPEWVWLTDADIRHEPEVLERLLTTAAHERRDFVSVMARLRCETGWERLLIPAFTYFFAGIYSFARVADERAATAAAAGGCMLIRTEVLDRIGGLGAVRDAVIDDVSLARACKAVGARLWLGYDAGVNSIRGYDTLAGVWGMVARTAYTQLGRNPLALVGCVAGLALVFFVPPAALLCGQGAMRLFGLLGYAAMVRTYLPMVEYLGVSRPWALMLPVAAALYAGMTVSSAWRHHRGAGAGWKGRAYG
ncbi:glycosyltransferase [Candidatus Binatia bacterium]|nr:glycosyltransferase [Candidatus Binatia bacterium]